MIERITYLFKLFDKRIWMFQRIVETEPKYIETNVSDVLMDDFQAWRNDTAETKSKTRQSFAKKRISS